MADHSTRKRTKKFPPSCWMIMTNDGDLIGPFHREMDAICGVGETRAKYVLDKKTEEKDHAQEQR